MKKPIAFIVALVSMLFLNMQSATFAKDAQKDAGTTEVKSYTRKNGTQVKAYTRKKKDAAATDTTQVKGYTKANGTKVESYTRKKATKSTN